MKMRLIQVTVLLISFLVPVEHLPAASDVTVSTATTSGGTFSSGNPNVFTPTANSSVANNGSIQTSLNAGTAVTLNTASGATGSGDSQIAGFYTLATAQVDFGDLPAALARGLPRRALPVAILAWLGVDKRFQGQGLGDRLLAQALRDCQSAGQTFAFIAVLLDCLHDRAKAFYQRWDFQELPGHPYRLFLSAAALDTLAQQ